MSYTASNSVQFSTIASNSVQLKMLPYFLLNSEGGYLLEILVPVVHAEAPASSLQYKVSV